MAMRGTTAKIDLTELEKLCSLQCTDEEIAAWFNVTTRTIERRRKNAKFAEVMERGKGRGRISIRRMQMKLLEEGNATMGVWLGKNILGQSDYIQHHVDGQPMLMICMPRVVSNSPSAIDANNQRGGPAVMPTTIDVLPEGDSEE